MSINPNIDHCHLLYKPNAFIYFESMSDLAVLELFLNLYISEAEWELNAIICFI